MQFRAFHQGIGFFARERLWHELHDSRVGVHFAKRQPVLIPPSAQKQSLGREAFLHAEEAIIRNRAVRQRI